MCIGDTAVEVRTPMIARLPFRVGRGGIAEPLPQSELGSMSLIDWSTVDTACMATQAANARWCRVLLRTMRTVAKSRLDRLVTSRPYKLLPNWQKARWSLAWCLPALPVLHLCRLPFPDSSVLLSSKFRSSASKPASRAIDPLRLSLHTANIETHGSSRRDRKCCTAGFAE